MIQRYYFFFSNSHTHPISKIFRDGYQHVELITDLESGLIVHLNPRWGRVDLGLTNEIPLPDLIKKQKELGRTVVLWRQIGAPDPAVFIARGPIMTCASYLAYTIGLPFWGVTPWQLYRKLMRDGGIEV